MVQLYYCNLCGLQGRLNIFLLIYDVCSAVHCHLNALISHSWVVAWVRWGKPVSGCNLSQVTKRGDRFDLGLKYQGQDPGGLVLWKMPKASPTSLQVFPETVHLGLQCRQMAKEQWVLGHGRIWSDGRSRHELSCRPKSPLVVDGETLLLGAFIYSLC